MNGTHGLNAALELVYVLYMPPDHAADVREELLRHGLSESRIKTINPAGSSRSLAAEKRPETEDRPPGTDDDRDADERRPIAALLTHPPQVDAGRFLPRSLKLGTYGDGRYNVVMRLRVVPEGRETVWISMTAAEPHAETGTDDEAREAAWKATDGPDPSRTESLLGGGDDSSVTITRCRCYSVECDGYKEMLRRYFVDRDDCDGHADGYRCGTSCRHPAATRCVYKKIADVLLENDECADGGAAADGQDVVEGRVYDESSSSSSSSSGAPIRLRSRTSRARTRLDDGGDGNDGSAEVAKSSRQVSAVAGGPSTPSSDRPTVASSARASTAARLPIGGNARRATAKKRTFFDKLLRRTKGTARPPDTRADVETVRRAPANR